MLQTVLAPNASPLTLDGTRTYIVGRSRRVVIDPGSDDPSHLEAIAAAVGNGAVECIVVTHAHPDHAAGSDELGARFGCPVRAQRRDNLMDGASIPTDTGEILALATPGHTTDHVALHWPDQRAVFCGDLMMGGHDTSLVAPPEGRLGPYLASLDRIAALKAAIIYPAHGPAFEHPTQAIERYRRHRKLRQEQVLNALGHGATDYDGLLDAVYGDVLDPQLRPAAMAALKAYLEHLQGLGRIRRVGRGWELSR